jgi:hypothetical protein
MELNKLVFGGLALGCLAAAGAGGYLAARQGAPETTVAAASAPAASVAPPALGDKPVAESEGVIAPEPAVPAVSAPAVATERRPAETVRRAAPVVERRTETRRALARPAPAASRAPVDAPPASASTPSTSPGMWETRPAVEPERAPAPIVEPEPPAPPAAPEMLDLVVPADAVLGLQIERTVTSETARVEDRVEARVTRDIRVGDRVAIPAGSVVQGSVTDVERGGKVKTRARLGIRFHTVVLADGSRLNIKTDSVLREGSSPTNESAAKIGGAAVGGAILGAILGGGKGAVIGGTVGAAGGTAATMAGSRNAAVLNAGTTVSVRVQQPVTVTVEKEN